MKDKQTRNARKLRKEFNKRRKEFDRRVAEVRAGAVIKAREKYEQDQVGR